MASSPTRRRFRETDQRCESQKACYLTKVAAIDQAEFLMDQGAVSPGCHIVPYVCPDCGWWHVANKRIVFTPPG